ncbi:site-specific integrase [Nocardia sp. NEAU-G5]|uniref:Site-specific integrase n=1 Tax=Nocardia albiluteola TaxID=2842303 RepID=A0ABS6AVU5_9NOCA|nr:site-specific integrase [Nocardia albiluteola]
MLRWWRWLRAVGVEWDRATSAEGRDLVLWLGWHVKPRNSPRTASRETAGTVNTYERVTGPALPHLFQYRIGWKWQPIGTTYIDRLIRGASDRAAITDPTGKPVRYTPHDFRRLWATDAVSNGLPVHIAAKILGHKQLSTTQVYAAVFDEHLIRSYRRFLDSRRSLRPEAEYREPTEQEWEDFQEHFEKRKLELGTCGRPYGSRCNHEFACLRCPSLRLDIAARSRLVEIIANLRDRITEARINGWAGEVDSLTVSLNAAAAKLASLDRTHQRSTVTADRTNLGLPVVQRHPSS